MVKGTILVVAKTNGENQKEMVYGGQVKQVMIQSIICDLVETDSCVGFILKEFKRGKAALFCIAWYIYFL